MMGEWKFKVREKEKTICLNLNGTINNVDAAMAFVEFKRTITNIEDGYTIICDICDFKSASFESRLLLESALKLMDTINPAKIIRVVNKKDELTIFDEAYRNLEVNYSVVKMLKSELS